MYETIKRFQMSCPNYDPAVRNEYSDMMLILEDMRSAEEDFKGIIKASEGNINVIKDTGWFTIPEVNKIQQELASGNTKIRGEGIREELFVSFLDIKHFKNEGDDYYFVGTK